MWKYTNIHVERYKCEKCKRVWKESKYFDMKKCKVTSNRNVKPNKVKTYKNNKQIETCVYYIYLCIQLYKQENMKIYKNACRNVFI